MGAIGVELLIVVVLILFNGVLAMSELAIVSARKTRLQQRAEAGDAGARAALALANEPTRFLSTVQIGITLVGILAGAFGGATLAETLTRALVNRGVSDRYAEAVAVGLVVLGITYLSLIVGELVPKRLALHSPERLAARVARPMRLLSVIAAPAVAVLSASTEFVLRLFGLRASTEPSVTEEEIKILIEQGRQAGVLAEAEEEILTRVFRLADRRVGELMTPRPQVVWLDSEDPPPLLLRQMAQSRHAWFPMAAGDLDHVLGMISAKDAFAALVTADEPLSTLPDLQALLRPALFVPESMAALKALDLFTESGMQLALVVDEFGGTQGLITLYDLLATIIADTRPLDAEGEPLVVRRDDGSFLLDGMLSVDELAEVIVLRRPLPEPYAYQTLGGFVLHQLGRIPTIGDQFAFDDLRFEVVDMDGNRVDRVLVTPRPTAIGGPAEDATE